jgi:hypothetical protein
VYGFVPEDTLEEVMRLQAKKIALKRLEQVNHSMRLEKQELDEQQKEKALEDMIQKILLSPPKNFWLL